MNDVVAAIEKVVSTYERLLIEEIEGRKIEEAEDAVKLLEIWRDHHLRALQYRDALEQRRRFAEMERQAQAMGGSAFGVGSFQLGQPQ